MNAQQPPVSAPASLRQSEFKGLIGVARQDITPPTGIYARLWGSARHNVAEGVHKPLLATCLYFAAADNTAPLALLALDLSWWRSTADELEIRRAILEHCGLDESQVMLHVSHSHAAPPTERELASRPGGHLIEAFRERIAAACKSIVGAALQSARPATMSWATGSCRLAFNRDLVSPVDGKVIVGLNPAHPADQTLLAGRAATDSGEIIATVVNYACHPTSVGGANRLISPDYVGALRETVEKHTSGAPCLFLHGASGDLTPRHSFAAGVAAADRNGAEIGHAALATLASMYSPGTALEYAGIQESGAKLALWREGSSPTSPVLRAQHTTVGLEFVKMPTQQELRRALESEPEDYMRERLRRKMGLRAVMDDAGKPDFPYLIWRVGDAFIVALPGEAHSPFQIGLRKRFPDNAIAVLNITNGYRSYLPPREAYDLNTYQAQVAIYAQGAAEKLLDSVTRTITELLNTAN
ncbi:MAG: neutral/alkaline non-lysosomal ceramidase N-terminal domain-containing protein [Proteobacteria bacterium]|nr:neutral/alkaline non-lysosomal ceramidase N-terminal domain-containing protein [Pseudomonadota bacterium]